MTQLKQHLQRHPKALRPAQTRTTLMEGVRLQEQTKLGDFFEGATVMALEGFPARVAKAARDFAMDQSVMVFRLGVDLIGASEKGPTLGFLVTENTVGRKGAVLWSHLAASETPDARAAFAEMVRRVANVPTPPKFPPLHVAVWR